MPHNFGFELASSIQLCENATTQVHKAFQRREHHLKKHKQT
ncbi:hypothetical protein FOMG_16260 [Fusarium oxysporum f. sp. melonis 26406]|uniref:Uncharacterized protein n=1 Tax=Fusarium oxysporum f. sp. melonis 26406 TaxID=1089452 RepID=W9Z727_FUSOX|nr:hypothetical protein FOMG_16260 [Fusarium oxysporum f. sp. melonis 26406]